MIYRKITISFKINFVEAGMKISLCVKLKKDKIGIRNPLIFFRGFLACFIVSRQNIYKND